MSASSSRNSKKVVSRHVSPLQNLGNRLASLAKKLAATECDVQAETLSDELFVLSTECLSLGNESALARAFETLELEGNYDAMCVLEDALEEASSEQCLQVVDKHKKQTLVQYSLFAIPVLYSLSAGQQLRGGTLQQGETFNALLSSFKAAGLIRPEANLAMEPYLYHTDELNELGFVQVSRLSRNLWLRALDGAPVSAEDLGQFGWPVEANSTAPELELRYLVGSTVDAYGAPLAFLPDFDPTDDEEANNAYLEKLMTWQDAFAKALGPMLVGDSDQAIIVGVPETFFEALRSGLRVAEGLMVSTNVAGALDAVSVLPRGASAVVSAHSSGEFIEELTITLLSELDGNLLAHLQRPVSEDEDDSFVLDALLEGLNGMDLAQVTVLEDVFPLSTDGICPELLTHLGFVPPAKSSKRQTGQKRLN